MCVAGSFNRMDVVTDRKTKEVCLKPICGFFFECLKRGLISPMGYSPRVSHHPPLTLHRTLEAVKALRSR